MIEEGIEGIIMPAIVYEPTGGETTMYFLGMVLSIAILFILPVILHSTYDNGHCYIPGIVVLYAGVFVSSLTGIVPELHLSIPDLPAVIFVWGFVAGLFLLVAGLVYSYRNYSCVLKEKAYAKYRY